MRISRTFAALLAACGIAAAAPASAFDVNPVVSVIELPADRSGITLTLRNPRTVDLPIIFEIVERVVMEDGSERQSDAEDEFLIFPPQAVVPPGRTQAVRVQWLEQPPSTSRSFTLYAAEVPIDLTQENLDGVQTIFRMGASIHVTPKGAQPQPVLADASEVEDGVRVTIANEGTRFIYIDDLSLSFDAATVRGLELANIAQRTLIPPEGRRSFVVPEVSGTPSLSTTR